MRSIVTALNFVGDGSQLTGINTIGVTTITAGDNILVTQTGQVAIITATFSGGATGFFEGTNGVGIGTTSKVGIGTTIPTQMLTVKGNIDLDGNIVLNGEISAPTRIKFGTGGENIKIGDITGGSGAANVAIGDQALSLNNSGAGHNIAIGQLAQYGVNSGQYNVAIGDRAGQNLTSGSYNVLLGAYSGNQNGLDIRTLSNNVVLSDGEGNVRQFINSSGDVGIKTTIITEALTVAGIVSATSFYGTLPASQLTGALPSLDGSALTGVTAIGSGVEIRDSDSPVGAAATINFGNNLSVVLSAGIATITGSNTASFATNAGGLTGSPSIIVDGIDAGPIRGGSANFTGILTASQIRFGSTGVISNLNSDMRQANTLTFGDGEFAMFHKGGGGDDYSFILVDNYPLYIGTQGDQGGSYYYTSLLTINPGNDSGTFGTNDAYATLGHAQNVSNGEGGTTLTRLRTTATGTTAFGNFDVVSGDITATNNIIANGNITGDTATNIAGINSVTASGFYGNGSGLTGIIASGTGIDIKDDGSNVGTASTINFGAGLNVELASGIATVTGVTTSIPELGIGNTDIIGQKSYALMKVGLSTTGWIRLYTDSTSRSNDVSRSVGEDPAPGSGVIAEVVTTGISTQQMITPFAMGGNMDEPVTNKIYVAIQNLSSSTQTITANLTILQLEA